LRLINIIIVILNLFIDLRFTKKNVKENLEVRVNRLSFELLRLVNISLPQEIQFSLLFLVIDYHIPCTQIVAVAIYASKLKVVRN